jgi:hypothetical protein
LANFWINDSASKLKPSDSEFKVKRVWTEIFGFVFPHDEGHRVEAEFPIKANEPAGPRADFVLTKRYQESDGSCSSSCYLVVIEVKAATEEATAQGFPAAKTQLVFYTSSIARKFCERQIVYME